MRLKEVDSFSVFKEFHTTYVLVLQYYSTTYDCIQGWTTSTTTATTTTDTTTPRGQEEEASWNELLVRTEEHGPDRTDQW